MSCATSAAKCVSTHTPLRPSATGDRPLPQTNIRNTCRCRHATQEIRLFRSSCNLNFHKAMQTIKLSGCEKSNSGFSILRAGRGSSPLPPRRSVPSQTSSVIAVHTQAASRKYILGALRSTFSPPPHLDIAMTQQPALGTRSCKCRKRSTTLSHSVMMS